MQGPARRPQRSPSGYSVRSADATVLVRRTRSLIGPGRACWKARTIGQPVPNTSSRPCIRAEASARTDGRPQETTMLDKLGVNLDYRNGAGRPDPSDLSIFA